MQFHSWKQPAFGGICLVMKKPISNSPDPNHRQDVHSNAGEIFLLDLVRPDKQLLAQLGWEWVPSQPQLLDKLRTSTSKVVIIAPVTCAGFSRNIALLDKIEYINFAGSSPRISCIYLLCDRHTKDQIEEYMSHGCQVHQRLAPSIIGDLARQALRRLRTNGALRSKGSATKHRQRLTNMALRSNQGVGQRGHTRRMGFTLTEFSATTICKWETRVIKK